MQGQRQTTEVTGGGGGLQKQHCGGIGAGGQARDGRAGDE
jgi:hypothetical protein